MYSWFTTLQTACRRGRRQHNKLPPKQPPWPRPCWQPKREKCVINDRGLVISAGWLTEPTTRLHRSQSTPSLISTHYNCGHTTQRKLHLCLSQAFDWNEMWPDQRLLKQQNKRDSYLHLNPWFGFVYFLFFFNLTRFIHKANSNFQGQPGPRNS